MSESPAGVLRARVGVLQQLVGSAEEVLSAKDPKKWMVSDPMIVKAYTCLKKAVDIGQEIAVQQGHRDADDDLPEDEFAPDFDHRSKLQRLEYVLLLFGPDRDNVLTRIYRSTCMQYGIAMFDGVNKMTDMQYDQHALDVAEDKNELIVECRDILTAAWKAAGKSQEEIAELSDNYLDMCWSYAEDALDILKSKYKAMARMTQLATELADKIDVSKQTLGGSIAIEMFGALLGEGLTDEQQGMIDDAGEPLERVKAEARIRVAAERCEFDLTEDVEKYVVPEANSCKLIDATMQENLAEDEIEALMKTGKVKLGE